MTMTKAIVHLDLDVFYVSCERRENRTLRGIPLIIGGNRQRGVVMCASYEARYFGVQTGMPMYVALQRCPTAKVIKGDFDLYTSCSNTITEMIHEQAPLMEKASIDEFYLDISGMDKYFGCLSWTSELITTIINETRLPISFGLSVNKTVSKMATNESKPLGCRQIVQDEVQPFLNPLSVKKIPGIGHQTFHMLSRIGIRKIKTLAEIPLEIMEKLLGKNGITLSQKANGIDTSPVKPYSDRKSISTQRTFHHDTINLSHLTTILTAMVESLCFQLRDEKWLTSSISVKIRYTNFDTHQRQMRIPYTASDHALLRAARELFTTVYNRRYRLRLIGVRFSNLVRGYHQIDMFSETPEMINLYQQMDHIRKRFYPSAIMRASAFGVTKDLRNVA